MARYLLLSEFPLGSKTLPAGSVLADEYGDPIAALQSEGAPLIVATPALEALAAKLAASRAIQPHVLADALITRQIAAGAVPQARTLTAGTGLTGGGDLSADRTFNVAANADGSILANADDVQVGVLASDTQHGVRGGGTQHAAAIAGGANGFLTGTDKTKLDGIPAVAGQVPVTWAKDADDALPADVTTERVFYRARGAETVDSIQYTPNGAQAGDDVNNVTITVRRRNGAGGAADVVVAYLNDVASGGMAAFVPKALGTLANNTLAAGNVLTIEVTKGALGQVLTAGLLSANVTRS